MPPKLLDSSSSSSEDEEETVNELKINEGFAQAFNRYREKEEYQKLKDKYGETVANAKLNQDDDDDSSSTDEEEDEEAKGWTKDNEKDFLITLASLKRKDSKLYDGSTSFFQKTSSADSVEKTANTAKLEKPITLVDLERQVITQKGGEFDELEDEGLKEQMNDKTYVQEMAEIKSSLKKAVTADSDDSDDDDDNGLFTKKVKSNLELKKDEEEYTSWLAGQKETLDDKEAEKDLKSLKDFWNDKKLDDGEKFLRDYILNKKYLEHGDDDSDEEEVDLKDDVDLSEDEKTLEQQAEFEHKYNFRFEEPDKEFIKRYPRTIQESMRRKDDSRKLKRDEVKDRKLKEKEKKREELKQLKAFKRKEILDKIEKLRKITGNDELAFKDEDLEEDFDPEKYDERMKEVFDEYDNAPGQAEDAERPVFSDLDSDLEIDNWDDYGGDEDEYNDGDEYVEDENDAGNQTDDVIPTSSKLETQKELLESSKGRKKSKKKKSKFAETLEAKKPVFDPEDNTFEQYLDEYYGLDYEDIIGDLPCRFKYRKVAANDLGLSTEEILSAPDRELNAWASLKKTCQYRTEAEEQQDIQEFKRKGGNLNLKKKLLPSIFKQDPEEDLQAEQEKKSSKGKKRRRRKGANNSDTTTTNGNIDMSVLQGMPSPAAPTAKKQKLDTNATENNDSNANDDKMSKSKKKRLKRKANNANNRGGSMQKQNNKSPNSTTPNNDKNKNIHHKNNKKKININQELSISDKRLEHYGLKPNQFKRKVRKQKYKEKSSTTVVSSTEK